MQSYHHFSIEERECLYEMRKEGKKQSEIAKAIGKSKSSVSREIKRNKNKYGFYQCLSATIQYKHRRKKCRRKTRLSDEKAKKYVEEGLSKYWSPETISARWKMETRESKLSHSTIYRAIKSGELCGYSRQTHLRRRGKKKNVHQTKVIHPVHTIHDRPEIVNERSRLGDMEGDTVYGGINKGVVVTLVDRCSRMLYAARSRSRDSQLIVEAFKTSLDGVHVESITLDNGTEFAKFDQIERNHNTTVYFADPHSPWQRGSNENINDLLRFFFPKGTDFHNVSDDELSSVVSLINHRPRKCLGWLSPFEFLHLLTLSYLSLHLP